MGKTDNRKKKIMKLPRFCPECLEILDMIAQGDLKQLDCEILTQLGSGEFLSQREVARRLNVHPTTVRRVIGRLRSVFTQ